MYRTTRDLFRSASFQRKETVSIWMVIVLCVRVSLQKGAREDTQARGRTLYRLNFSSTSQTSGDMPQN